MAAKGYFDTLVKLGELASDSQGSKELGECVCGEGVENESAVDLRKFTEPV